jgi:type I restriction enzyme, S subunit
VTPPEVALPQGWDRAVIGDLIEPAVEQKIPGGAGTFTYIEISSIDNQQKQITAPTLVERENAPSRARQVIREGDILVSMTRPNLNAVAIVPGNLGGAIASTGFDVLRTRHVSPRWLFYLVQSPEFVATMSRLVLGVVYPAVRPKDIRSFPVSLPPRPEQDRIVAELEKQLTRLEASIGALERSRSNLQRYRTSVLKAACEGRLVSTEAELARAERRSYEPTERLLARILEARRRRWEAEHLAELRAKGRESRDDGWKLKYQEPAPPDTAGLPELPEGWCWANLSMLIDEGPQNGLYLPRTDYGESFCTPILRIDDFQNETSRSSDELKRVRTTDAIQDTYSLKENDLVINRVNSLSHLGKCLLIKPRHVPAIFESNMMRMSLMPAVHPAYIEIYLHSAAGRGRLISTAKWAVNQASINQQDVRKTPVPLPPLVEQSRIIAEIERRLSDTDRSSASVNQSLLRTRRLRQATQSGGNPMRKSSLLILAVGLVLATSTSLAQELNLEVTDPIWLLKSCDRVHAISGESKCTTYHVTIGQVQPPQVSTQIYLDGKPYVIQWMGTGYYLASGRILQEASGSEFGGLQMLEIRPSSGLVHKTSWQDRDQDGQISVSDTFTVDGRAEPIVDLRLNIRVVPSR